MAGITMKLYVFSPAQERLIRKYQPVVRKIAGAFYRPERMARYDHDDLVQFGNLGLQDAVATFDRSRGVTFKTYAYGCIRRRLNHATSWWANGPFGTYKTQAQAHLRHYKSAAVKAGPDAREADILDSMGLTDKSRAHLERIVASTRSSRESFFDPAIGPALARVDREIESVDVRDEVGTLLSVLTPRERRSIELLYGLGDEPPQDPVEVARRFGVHRHTVYEWRRRAFRRLRTYAAARSA